MSRRVFLNPGELYFGGGEVLVETLLGSCVAIVLRHRKRAVAGVCHFLLPERIVVPRGVWTLDGRYGEDAFRLLMAQLRRNGHDPDEFEAKLFGGARVFDTQTVQESVGEGNARYARRLLKQAGMRLVCSDLGGNGYRYLRVDVGRGDVWVRYGRTMPISALRKTQAGLSG
ncbi:MAG TPA: chemotaxis protein CheD [Chitinolyticbacter sp.]|nr:chemotaxis protein CheD [Chitinolyticbacter sp.]